MADMMASGEVGGLLLSPKFKLWQICSSHVCPTIGTKGLLAWVFLVYFMSYVNRIDYFSTSPPLAPSIPVNVVAEHVIIL
jgi:hypothetical protein